MKNLNQIRQESKEIKETLKIIIKMKKILA